MLEVWKKKSESHLGSTVLVILLHTPVKSYVIKWPQEKWACYSHDEAMPLSFHLQVTQVFFFKSYKFFIMEKWPVSEEF